MRRGSRGGTLCVTRAQAIADAHARVFNRAISRHANIRSDRMATSITVTPIAGSLGAEVTGVDLRTMDNHDWAQVHQAFLDHKVIAIRDQALTPQDLMDVGARFGEPNHYPS
jgi:hypothetical protein